jgi:hypothetical protein
VRVCLKGWHLNASSRRLVPLRYRIPAICGHQFPWKTGMRLLEFRRRKLRRIDGDSRVHALGVSVFPCHYYKLS